MIRSRVVSLVGGLWNRLGKATGRNGLLTELKNHWMEVVYIIGIVLMTSGIVSAIIQPVNFGYTIFPSTTAQSGTETAVDALAVIIGSAGIYMSYLSGRQTTKPRMVNFFLVLGLLLIAISVYIGYYVLTQK